MSPEKRISIDDARRGVLEHAARLPDEEVALDDALGRVLAVDAVAPSDLPPFSSSGMDGFAVVAADTTAPPVRLRIAGESRAGAPAAVAVVAGTAIRVSTGAQMPDGADAVVRQELTEPGEGEVVVLEAVEPGNDVRYAGEDIPCGATILEAGTLLGAAEIGGLAAVNIARPRVVRRPRLALVSTGDEIVDPGRALEPGEIRDANRPALTAAARAAGAEVIASLRVRDDREDTIARLAEAMEGADIVATIGGVSVGPHDHVRPALERLGAEKIFCRVSLKPGGQVCFYRAADGTLVFALPGNPASALTAFRVLVVPAIYAMLGRSQTLQTARGVAAVDLPGTIGRTSVIRCYAEMHDDGWHVTPNGDQRSHILTSMIGLPALALVPEDREVLPAGEPVDIEFVG
ncbi:MAG TPA: gephyrin-like molybdotransferase Glp [Solirubrobacteraceae bacterium]|jgi:molybdopterin molybdotransferase|nr:gephyrin-like molybdotransferase Glp [Solirubrobacteraceae bacterium]